MLQAVQAVAEVVRQIPRTLAMEAMVEFTVLEVVVVDRLSIALEIAVEVEAVQMG